MKVAGTGAGAMGAAMATGLADAGIMPNHITVANPHYEKLAPLQEAGMTVTTDNCLAVKNADLIVIAVKPWIVPEVIEQLKACIDYDRQEVTVIVAGISSHELKAMMLKESGTQLPVLSIAMPNTAMTLRQSMTFIVEANGKANNAVKSFGLLGKVMTIEERLLPAATALASCGIAYAMRYVRAASEGGVELGFRASQAQEIVVETLKGAAALLSRQGAHPETEIDKVTTPGGITIKGLNAMEAAGFSAAVIAGLKAGK
ncbi:MAG: NAD(P)-binding domain-containing protein [Muribaculaceae bacterium]|nr:NAD(P)-binding domain-containing protein [Muribaculaceae bacterium]